jgi:gluconokinase
LVVVMGVSGCGKSTVGGLLAECLGVPYTDADDFHPPANVEKMSAGEPLTDADRAPWLDALADWIVEHRERGAVISCSALKRRYRDRLRAVAPELFFLHLDGSPQLIASRMAARMNHFMPPDLLRSQFETLEPLQPDEAGAVIPIDVSSQWAADQAICLLPGMPGLPGLPGLPGR